MKKIYRTFHPAYLAAGIAALTALTSCEKLSNEARMLAGNYYIDEISTHEPLYELRADGTCSMRAIRPGVLVYQVDGRWDVKGDSLVAVLDPSTLVWEGDSTLIGRVARNYSRHIVNSDERSLTVEKDGVTYLYHRRWDTGGE